MLLIFFMWQDYEAGLPHRLGLSFSTAFPLLPSSFQNSNRSQYSPCFFTYQNSEFSIPQYSVFNSSTTASTVGIMSAFYLINCSVYGNFCRCGRGRKHCLSYSQPLSIQILFCCFIPNTERSIGVIFISTIRMVSSL